MAKCNICMKVKGKRKCLANEAVVCSSCCGISREKAKCAGCSFYKDPAETRRYDKTQYISLHEMGAGNLRLQDVSNVIEGAMCSFDVAQDRTLHDGLLKNVTERLLDRYAFGDQELSFANALEEEGCTYIDRIICEDLSEEAPDLIGKVLGTVYRSIKRHGQDNYNDRQYIKFIHQYVGVRVATGVRALASLG